MISYANFYTKPIVLFNARNERSQRVVSNRKRVNDISRESQLYEPYKTTSFYDKNTFAPIPVRVARAPLPRADPELKKMQQASEITNNVARFDHGTQANMDDDDDEQPPPPPPSPNDDDSSDDDEEFYDNYQTRLPYRTPARGPPTTPGSSRTTGTPSRTTGTPITDRLGPLPPIDQESGERISTPSRPLQPIFRRGPYRKTDPPPFTMDLRPRRKPSGNGLRKSKAVMLGELRAGNNNPHLMKYKNSNKRLAYKALR